MTCKHDLDASGNPIIMWTPEKLQAFKKLYQKAVESGNELFVFEGLEVLAPYAKHLIEFLESKFDQPSNIRKSS